MPKSSDDELGQDAILAREICLSYRLFNSVSLKRQFLPSNNREKAPPKSFQALTDVSFRVRKGETLGLIGSNGAGKSTLLKVLAGVIQIDSGELLMHTQLVSLLTLGTGFEVNLSGVDNIYINAVLLGMTRKEVDEKLADIIAFADIGDFIQKHIRTYSTGMRARLAFSIASNISPDILLIDEVLGVGDEAFRIKSGAVIQDFIRSDRTVVIASHSVPTIRELCDRVLWLEKGNVKAFGPAGEVADAYLEFAHRKSRSV